jgi:hypothetical protein
MTVRDGSDSDSTESAAPKRVTTRAMKVNIAPEMVQTLEVRSPEYK